MTAFALHAIDLYIIYTDKWSNIRNTGDKKDDSHFEIKNKVEAFNKKKIACAVVSRCTVVSHIIITLI